MRKPIHSLYLIQKKAILAGAHLTDVTASVKNRLSCSAKRELVVNMKFNNGGAETLSQITATNIGRRLAVVLDDEVVSAPNITERIPHGNVEIAGDFDSHEVQHLVAIACAGTLHVPMQLVETAPVTTP